jgi:D-amino peptidase
MKPILILLVVICLPAGVDIAAQAPAKKLKLHISVDMEGVTGAVTPEQLGPQGFEYARFREFMTAEVLAAIEAAMEAGATEIVVADSHGNGQNLLIERFPPHVTVVRSWPRPLMMMEGIDESFDAAIFLGYHVSIHGTEGVRAHSISSAYITALRLNGVPMSEASLNAAVAGHFGVPVLMISGDDATVREAQQQLGPIEGAIVKWNYGNHSARTLTPQAGQELIRQKVGAALARRAEFRPYRIEAPLELEIRLKHYMATEVLSYLPSVERVDSHTIRFRAKDITEVTRFISFLTRYRPDLTP